MDTIQATDYTLAILLRSTNARHFRLMLESIYAQTCAPTQVLYVAFPNSGSAVVQMATTYPLMLECEQKVLWCTRQELDQRLFHWSILEAIANHLTTPTLIMTESDVVLHREFSCTLLALSAQGRTIATAFPTFLSAELSNRLDEAAISNGEPFRTWGQTWKDSLIGRSRYARRIIPLGRLGIALDRCSIRRQLSSTALAMGYEVLTAL
ncbi:MAG: hypothetical protein RMK00_08645, partial [Bacteroidota bacterium]|nr:hypothetical protein [Bacteroidota bacterium]